MKKKSGPSLEIAGTERPSATISEGTGRTASHPRPRHAHPRIQVVNEEGLFHLLRAIPHRASVPHDSKRHDAHAPDGCTRHDTHSHASDTRRTGHTHSGKLAMTRNTAPNKTPESNNRTRTHTRIDATTTTLHAPQQEAPNNRHLPLASWSASSS